MPPRSVTSAQGRTTAGGGNFSQGFGRPSGEDRPSDNAAYVDPGLAAAVAAQQAAAAQAQREADQRRQYAEAQKQTAAAFRAQEAERARVQGLGGSVGGYDLYQGALQDALMSAQQKLAASQARTPASFSLLDTGANLGNQFMQQRFIDVLSSRIGPRDSEAYQAYLSAPKLARPVFGPQGIVGVYDERGRLTGRDPEREEEERLAQRGQGGMDARPTYTAPDPQTGECDPGYIFDEDLQACRLDTGVSAPVDFGADVPTYARMGLLDVAPTGLLEFGQRFGTSPGDFGAANLAFRRATGTRPSYFQAPPKLDGYTLLS